jgi:DNA-binding transcriptional ArsR family regulator
VPKATERELALFFALSSPLRVNIFQCLQKGESSVKEISEQLDLKHSRISQELHILREVKLVTSRTEGRHHYYKIRTAGLKPILKWLDQFKGE